MVLHCHIASSGPCLVGSGNKLENDSLSAVRLYVTGTGREQGQGDVPVTLSAYKPSICIINLPETSFATVTAILNAF